MARLTKGDITLREMIVISYDYYRKRDDKEWRASLDITNARLNYRSRFSYNQTKKQWEQTGRDCKFTFVVKSNPVSYKKIDSLRYHYYPVTFIVYDVSKGIDSPIKWRTGGLYKPKSIKKGIHADQRKKLVEQDIKNGTQLQFFLELEYILQQYGLLYGINWAGWPPRHTNPDFFPFFDKHAWFIASKILVPLLGKEGLRLRQMWKNE
jgi:hypothetical protein